MRFVSSAALLAALLLAALPLAAQESPRPEVDTAEILRWGDRVVVSGEGHRDAGETLFSEAMSPPADDSDQWYVTVWGTSRDQATLAVVKAFERDPHLAAFVAAPPGEKTRPWAHFNFYRADDRTQSWRFAEHKIPSSGPFPIVTIQTPRNGRFGKFGLVIDRIEASQLGAQPAELGKRMQASVRLYLKKLQESQRFARAERSRGHEQAEPVEGEEVGNFPWGPDAPPSQQPLNFQFPLNGPANETPQGASLAEMRALLPDAPADFLLGQSRARATIDQVFAAWRNLQTPAPAVPTPAPAPAVQPSGNVLLTLLFSLLGGAGGGSLISLGFGLWGTYRAVKKSKGETLLVNDELFALFEKFLAQKQTNQAP
jgi:hypothetical protein